MPFRCRFCVHFFLEPEIALSARSVTLPAALQMPNGLIIHTPHFEPAIRPRVNVELHTGNHSVTLKVILRVWPGCPDRRSGRLIGLHVRTIGFGVLWVLWGVHPIGMRSRVVFDPLGLLPQVGCLLSFLSSFTAALAPGSQIRLFLASRDYPFFLPNISQPTVLIYRDPTHPSALLLPIAP